jgi:hypothetical protein
MQAFLFPEVCDLPFGLHWPTTTSFPNFADSLKAALGKSHQHFNSILLALRPQLEPWFQAMSTNPVIFRSLVGAHCMISIFLKSPMENGQHLQQS